jgi:hypothetical protein
MSEPGKFLSRWSRLKRAAGESDNPPQVADSDAGVEAVRETVTADAPPTQGQTPAAKPSAAPAESEFDIAKLPPIESIVADTDIRAFLQPGVPADLRHAALRRAWSADPAIRDFKGLQENDWDFNDPDAIPGFGKLAPDFDVRKMASRIFADEPDNGGGEHPTSTQSLDISNQFEREKDAPPEVETPVVDSDEPEAPAAVSEMLQRNETVAMHQGSNSTVDQNPPRRHGGALPR